MLVYKRSGDKIVDKQFVIMYYVAIDFIKLNFSQKINLGIDLGLISRVEHFEDENLLEERIFTTMWRRHKFQEFADLLYEIKHE